MLPTSFHFPASSQRKGSALIISLFLIVITSMILVGYATTSRNEVASAGAFLDEQNAKLFAQMANDNARAKLEAALSGAGKSPATAPGLIIKPPASSTSIPEDVKISAPVQNTYAKDVTANFNRIGLLSEKNLLIPTENIALPVSWIYVRKNGTMETATSGVPSVSTTNPVIGRYSFYTDDEGARINLNTASTRTGNTTSDFANPSRIDLTGVYNVSSGEVTKIKNYRGTNPQVPKRFSTPLSALEALHQGPASEDEEAPPAGALEVALSDYPESFTHFNHSSVLNVFGEKKRVLTTKRERAGNLDYFTIFAPASDSEENPPSSPDPGTLANINAEAVQTLFETLYDQLSRTDWPMLKDKSFVDKYGAAGCAQIALNIIDYVRSVESTADIVEPLRGNFSGGSFTLKNDAAAPETLIGNSRRPLITEIGAAIPNAPTSDGSEPPKEVFEATIWTKISYPALHAHPLGDTPGPIKISDLKLAVTIKCPQTNGSKSYTPVDENMTPVQLPGETSQPSDDLPVGGSLVIARKILIPQEDFESGTLPAEVQFEIRATLSTDTNIVCDVVPLNSSSAIAVKAKPGQSVDKNESKATRDPFVNHHVNDWFANVDAATPDKTSSFDQTFSNITGIGASSSIKPPQDTDANDHLTSISVGIPGKGTSITSPGFLGFVHTGIVTGATPAAGTPWRTIRLQPQEDAATTLPDWALVDLFAAVRDTSSTAELKGLEGTINLNTSLTPFQSAPQRELPLRALLMGASKDGNSTITNFGTSGGGSVLIQNILNKKTAANGHDYANYPSDDDTVDGKRYCFPGEIVEIEGIADGGEASEALVRELLPLITTRSNVFRVYAIGQAISQTSSGEITVRSERKTISLLEVNNTTAKVVYQQNWEE